MRNLFFTFLLFSLFSCEKNETNDILPFANVDVTINLNLPQYLDLQTPSEWIYIEAGANKGLQGLFLQNVGLTPPFKAYERACPNNDCTIPMTFDGSLKLKCSCDNSEYSIIEGSPQTAGNSHFAREYKVTQINPTTLIITNN
ncbi:MAG: hypothetical protein GQ540_11950 [Lutibacter sp.]|uniref:hypothetical protein n=1 Tax=Lutibacter sp. TaxID=1925666 RepID=UPI0019EF9D74|nr:hypothetical protein [Lutibacter sp.]NOR29230.1 hypothetical protein [Lutibacter sp.]